MIQGDSANLQQWQRYIEQEIGFILPNTQLQWLTNAIDHTAILNGLTTQQLWYQLPKNNEIRQQLLDKVLIHESRFFRHKPSIDFITRYAIDKCADDRSKPFRIWSVGCASGHETWSLAMSLTAAQLSNHVILGTDVSEQAITNARLGQYDQRQYSLIPQNCQQFVYPLITKNAGNELSMADTSSKVERSINTQFDWQVAPALRPYVSFALHNVIEQKSPTSHLQNVIICQNMLLYFRKFDQRDILAWLSEQCAVEGYIILAPGEALFWRPSNMRRIAHPQVNVWQKISA
ncbi:chemotaxis protein CheR [Psychrobacter pacificensis]|nr:chemotaxis protein CheR [Psychrobacter pacificensis]